MNRSPNPGVLEAIQYFDGSHTKLANALNVSQPNVHYWLYTSCPPHIAIEIEVITGIKKLRERIRPDLFNGKKK